MCLTFYKDRARNGGALKIDLSLCVVTFQEIARILGKLCKVRFMLSRCCKLLPALSHSCVIKNMMSSQLAQWSFLENALLFYIKCCQNIATYIQVSYVKVNNN